MDAGTGVICYTSDGVYSDDDYGDGVDYDVVGACYVDYRVGMCVNCCDYAGAWCGSYGWLCVC